MNYRFLLIFFIFIESASAQDSIDFDKFGRRIFSQITDTSYTGIPVSFIRTKEYHALIDRQSLSEDQKALMKHKINEDFNNMYMKYSNSLLELDEDYLREIADGATFEYMATRYEPLEGSVDTYAVKTNYIYRNGKVQTLVSFVYDVAWLGNRFVLISGIKEDF